MNFRHNVPILCIGGKVCFWAKKRCLIAHKSHQTSYLKWVWSLFLAWVYLLPIREVQPQMVEIPTIVSMRTIAVFVNIVRLLSFFIKEACASLLLSWTILLAVFLHKQGLSVISECKNTTFCVRTQFFFPIFFRYVKFLDFTQK